MVHQSANDRVCLCLFMAISLVVSGCSDEFSDTQQSHSAVPDEKTVAALTMLALDFAARNQYGKAADVLRSAQSNYRTVPDAWDELIVAFDRVQSEYDANVALRIESGVSLEDSELIQIMVRNTQAIVDPETGAFIREDARGLLDAMSILAPYVNDGASTELWYCYGMLAMLLNEDASVLVAVERLTELGASIEGTPLREYAESRDLLPHDGIAAEGVR